MPKVSICIPVYNMENSAYFLKRNLDSIVSQTFENYEIIVSDDSEGNELELVAQNYPVKYIKNKTGKGMATNSNNAINNAKGDLVKILYQDDYLYNEHSLYEMVSHFKNTNWLVTACTHSFGNGTFNNHQPYYSYSENTLGSPSVVLLDKRVMERFDPTFTWVLDLDLYRRIFKKYGRPRILNKVTVVIGLHKGQKTNLLTEQYKSYEYQLLTQKYEQHTSIAARL